MTGVKENTHHCTRACRADKVELAENVANLVAGLPCGTKECDDHAVGILQLRNILSDDKYPDEISKTHEDVCARWAWPPSVLKPIRTVEKPSSLGKKA